MYALNHDCDSLRATFNASRSDAACGDSADTSEYALPAVLRRFSSVLCDSGVPAGMPSASRTSFSVTSVFLVDAICCVACLPEIDSMTWFLKLG